MGIANQRTRPAATICARYKSRWQVELFFKWIQLHLGIEPFDGTSKDVVRMQLWGPVSVDVLVAMVEKHPGLDASLHTLRQNFSLTLCEKCRKNKLTVRIRP